jgi:hypothetical protein
MTSHPEIVEVCSFAAIARAVVAVCALGLAAPAPAQELRPPGNIPSQQPGESAANPSAAPAPDSVFQPGFVDTIGQPSRSTNARRRFCSKAARRTMRNVRPRFS